MVTWREIHGFYSGIDKRICSWESYVDEELRPYHSETGLRFRLNKSLEIPDTTHEFGGVSGGLAPTGHILPPIVFPPQPIYDLPEIESVVSSSRQRLGPCLNATAQP
jgi:hypothetical protein